MFKAVCLSTLTLLSYVAVLDAWGQKSPIDKEQPSIDLHFPLNSQQAWGVEESLLIWKTYEDDVDYAVNRKLDSTSPSDQDNEFRIKHPDFEWNTGVRLKLTRYLPSRDPWDINVIATYYYSEGEDDTETDVISAPNFEKGLFSTWETADMGTAQEAEVHTRMNFFTFDLTAGRYYSLTRKVDIHPFIGIRSVLNYQKYKANYSLLATAVPLTKTTFNGDHDFWGVGPRVGTDLAMQFGRHWSFLATFAGSFFAGRFDISERLTGNNLILQTPVALELKLNDEDTVLRSNIEASLGLGWEKWVRGKTVRIAPSFVFEVSEWFSMKRWVDTRLVRTVFSQGTQPQLQAHRRYSDLGLMGFNVNLQVDF